MSYRHRAFCLSIALFSLLHGLVAEYSSKSDLEYEFGDYRGKWCIDDHGFVYGIGEVYYPSPSACPCMCTVDGPVCVRPKCPRIHPRCTRIKYKGCCPVCEAVAKVCVYGGKTYRVLEEFKVSLIKSVQLVIFYFKITQRHKRQLRTITPILLLHNLKPTFKNAELQV